MLNDITCSQCSRLLSHYNEATDTNAPSAEEIFNDGAVAIPNFGWFCSQGCASEFEKVYGRKLFQRNANGDVEYYEKPILDGKAAVRTPA
jgi:hypothetical protein